MYVGSGNNGSIFLSAFKPHIVKAIIGDANDYIIRGNPLQFGSNASSTECVVDEMLCITFEAVDDAIKEAEDKFKLYLYTNDSGVCFCPDQAHVTILEDDDDSKWTSNHLEVDIDLIPIALMTWFVSLNCRGHSVSSSDE